jgi:tetratricopeptide (TPR) repeat protein
MAQLTIQQAFDLAVQHHQAGRLQEAEQLYRQVLAQQPNHAEALHLLGVLAGQGGRNELAVDLIRRAVGLKPDLADAHYNLGKALTEIRRADEAIASYRQAIRLQPGDAVAHNNLGIALRDTGQFEKAVASHRDAIWLKPDYPEAHYNLGIALKDMGRLDDAIASYRRAIAINPHYAEAHSNLGNALQSKGQLDEAVASHRQAIRLKPDSALAHNNLGGALNDIGQLDEAIVACRRAIALRPDYPEAHSNLGNALKDKGQLDEAIAACRQAIALRPDYAEAHFNLSLCLLTRGDFQPGWEEYEWRWKCKDLSPPRDFARPQWDGRPLEGRTLLLHMEQGLGDAIQLIRYLPGVEQRGGKLIIECYAELQRLFQTMAGRCCQIVVPGQPLPAFDFHCPLLSLPRVFGTNLANIPQIVPYLNPDPALLDAWSRTLGSPDGQLRVGLAWAGSPRFKANRTRSLNLQQLAPLAAVRGARFYSLQKGPAGEQAKNPPRGLELVDLGPKLNDFADTAAVMSLMDLIITTDTSVPHLAGALARPVWVMLQFMPDWRWLLDREDSPWYPTMRLFRQPRIGDWDSVITRVVEALSLWIKTETKTEPKPGQFQSRSARPVL